MEKNNMYAIRYSELPEHVICSRALQFEFDVPLVNGRLTPVIMLVLPTTKGFKPIEMIVSRDLNEKDIQDLEALEWKVVQKTDGDVFLPPVLTTIQQDDLYFVAYTSAGLQPFKPLSQQIDSRSIDRFAPWPDNAMYRNIRNKVESTLVYEDISKSEVTFVTFNEYFSQKENMLVPIKDRGIEYARYARRVRTSLDALVDVGQEVYVIRGDQSRMPSVIIEEEQKTQNMRPGAKYALLCILSHASNTMPTIDCLGVAIMDQQEIIAKIYIWPNYLFGEDAIDESIDMAINIAKRYGVSEIYQRINPQPFSVCTCCGELEIPFLESLGEYQKMII